MPGRDASDCVLSPSWELMINAEEQPVTECGRAARDSRLGNPNVSAPRLRTGLVRARAVSCCSDPSRGEALRHVTSLKVIVFHAKCCTVTRSKPWTRDRNSTHAGNLVGFVGPIDSTCLLTIVSTSSLTLSWVQFNMHCCIILFMLTCTDTFQIKLLGLHCVLHFISHYSNRAPSCGTIPFSNQYKFPFDTVCCDSMNSVTVR